MSNTVYLLFSPSFNKTYVGFTSDLEARLKSHNELGKKDWAIRYRPWILVHSEEFKTKAEAMAREKFFKSGVGRIRIQEILRLAGFRL